MLLAGDIWGATYKLQPAGGFGGPLCGLYCPVDDCVKRSSRISTSFAIIYIDYPRTISSFSVGKTLLKLPIFWLWVSLRKWPFLHAYAPTFIYSHLLLGMSKSMPQSFNISIWAVPIYKPANMEDKKPMHHDIRVISARDFTTMSLDLLKSR